MSTGFLGESPFWGRFWEASRLEASDRRLLSKAREQLREIFTDYGQDPQTYSLIHGDLHPGNILKTGNGLQVIDFDDAGFGWHLYELAVALFHYQSNPHFGMIRDALVAGYRSQRSLSDEALDLLPAFLLMRALATLGWIDARPGTRPSRRVRVRPRVGEAPGRSFAGLVVASLTVHEMRRQAAQSSRVCCRDSESWHIALLSGALTAQDSDIMMPRCEPP